MQDIFDAAVRDANGNRILGTQLTLFQSLPVPDPNVSFQSMDDYDYEDDYEDYENDHYKSNYDSMDEYMYDSDDRWGW